MMVTFCPAGTVPLLGLRVAHSSLLGSFWMIVPCQLTGSEPLVLSRMRVFCRSLVWLEPHWSPKLVGLPLNWVVGGGTVGGVGVAVGRGVGVDVAVSVTVAEAVEG